MRNLFALKATSGNEPFDFYVFTEWDCEDDIAELIINDKRRYDVVLEVYGKYEITELVEDAQNGDFTSPRISVLRG